MDLLVTEKMMYLFLENKLPECKRVANPQKCKVSEKGMKIKYLSHPMDANIESKVSRSQSYVEKRPQRVRTTKRDESSMGSGK